MKCLRCQIDLDGVAAILGDANAVMYHHAQAHVRDDLATAVELLRRARDGTRDAELGDEELGIDIDAFIRLLDKPIIATGGRS